MKISKENIHENKIRCSNTMQITLDDDFNVPDSKPDIDSIVKEWGNIHIDAVKTATDRAEVTGALEFAILYIGGRESDGRHLPVKMSGSMDIKENINLSEDADGTYVTCEAKLEDLTVKSINSRKISVKALVHLTLICEEIHDVSIGCEMMDNDETEKMQVLTRNADYTQLTVNMRDNFRIRESILLSSGKPSIDELIWDDLDVRSLNTRLTDQGMTINGEINVFIMYISNDESQSLQWYESEVGFEGTLDINGCTPDMISYVKYNIINKNLEIKPDYDGENREISIEMVLDLDVKAYEEMQKPVICDIYSPIKKVTLEEQKTEFRRLLVHNNSKCRAQDRIKVDDYIHILQICNCTGTAQVDDVTVDEDGLQIDGAIIANIFYITADDNVPMGSVRTAIPFSQKIPIKNNGKMEYNINASIEQLTAVMTGSSELEIKGCVALDTICFEPYSFNATMDCKTEEYPEDEFLKFPSIIGYIANGEDTLWEIAKKHHTTSESIRNMNHSVAERLTDDACVRRGEKLILIKSAR